MSAYFLTLEQRTRFERNETLLQMGLSHFEIDFIEKQKPLPSEISKLVDDNFWDLIETK